MPAFLPAQQMLDAITRSTMLVTVNRHADNPDEVGAHMWLLERADPELQRQLAAVLARAAVQLLHDSHVTPVPAGPGCGDG